MIAAGTLDRRLQVMRAALVDDGYARIEQFQAYGQPIRAARRDVSDGERIRAEQVGSTITTRFIVRRNSFTLTLTVKDRLICDGAEFAITGIKELGREGFELTASAEGR